MESTVILTVSGKENPYHSTVTDCSANGKQFTKIVSAGDSFNEIDYYYYDGSDTYSFNSNSKDGTKHLDSAVNLRGHDLHLPNAGTTLTVGTAQIGGKEYYCETGVLPYDGETNTGTYCFEGNILKYIIYNYEADAYTGESTYFHTVTTFRSTCSESAFALPEDFPSGYAFTEK